VRVLVIEDEPTVREALVRRLRDNGFVVDVAADGVEGEYAGREFPIDAALVDLGLPGKPGLEVIRAWRQAGLSFPVLILTARDRWQEKVEALQCGADDYVTKPFQFEEVEARLQALLRRAGGWSQPVLRSGSIELDPSSQRVRAGGREVELTAFEYRLLEYLMVHAGDVVSKSELTDKLY
jgi:two-component system response regulator PhoP